MREYHLMFSAKLEYLLSAMSFAFVVFPLPFVCGNQKKKEKNTPIEFTLCGVVLLRVSSAVSRARTHFMSYYSTIPRASHYIHFTNCLRQSYDDDDDDDVASREILKRFALARSARDE